MGRIIESKVCEIKITKQSVVDNLLSGVNPGVLASDLVDISLGGDSSFIDVFVTATISGQKTTQRVFSFTKEDFTNEVLSLADPELNDPKMIENIKPDNDATKILVSLNRKSVAVY